MLPVLGPAEHARIGRADEADGPDPAIDWLLRMRRFDNEGLLDRLAARGALTDAQIDALAQRIAAFHDALPASPAAYGDPEAVLAWARANFDALGSDASPSLARLDRTRVRPHRAALALRRAQGFVREGHGDLHLGNIVMVDGEPLPFDGIEFNAALRHTDTMADVAFTFMDLWRHGLPRQAWRFVSGYAEHTGDYGGLALLPFFAVVPRDGARAGGGPARRPGRPATPRGRRREAPWRTTCASPASSRSCVRPRRGWC